MQVVAEMVHEAGGTVWIGDSPSGPMERSAHVMCECGATAAAEAAGATVVPFDQVIWKYHRGVDYFIAPPVLDADLVINLPKLKTHMLTSYTGAIKNLYGVITGTRKRELHLYAPGVEAFGEVMVDVLELVQPGLTILDGVEGIDGNGPGLSGTWHAYGCIAASTDPVALDTAVTQGMGYRPGEVYHLIQASARGLGVSDGAALDVVGDRQALAFGRLNLPRAHWYLRLPSWVGAPVRQMARVRPQVRADACTGCGQCAEACPRDVITPARPPVFELENCIGCMCCAEICPQGAILPNRNLLARLIGIGH
jgi:uncharacterized protein (DUF362 family)/NAD-dependent dihydropyrimidine dehydrogenase PreA subunit